MTSHDCGLAKVTPEQTAQFRDKGYLLLRQAIDKKAVQPVKAHVLRELKRQRIWSDGRTLSSRIKDLPAFRQITTLGKSVQYPALKERIMAQPLVSAIRKLSGTNLVPEQQAQLLLSLPDQGEWTLEGLNWHRDISQLNPDRSPGIQAFFLVDDVRPDGGATLALAGSHRIVSYRSVNHDSGRVMKVDGKAFPVLEMSGRVGDVYLMDMRLLHTPSVNATKHVRMMATIRYFAM